ncbi:Flp pilus assembly protein CpaB [Streptomyces sp. A7024]|uniref:Flp pilus assembly protein CpaB n=1 Tax=Streptomyces coryli TaxID=1128680 RepID=A0A6G4U7A0_9ACTN|nr:Flp pilus assembly protein CpaB [Streptomyces coryli]NGN67071.1 Flp pilus assembly protein CpaB [Streptomyces coryli]
MNSRQRRGIIVLLLSVLLAFGAFVGVLSVISDAESKVGPEVSAYRLKSDVAPYKAIDQTMVEKVSMPKRWLSKTAVRDLKDLNGKIALTQLRKGSLLQGDMLAARPELKAGQQEIAIMIDAETGVAGKINPGATVNIYATFAGEGGEGGAVQRSVSKVLVNNARVIDVGQLTPLEPKKGEDRDSGSTEDGGEGVPITFALDTTDAQRVAYAESFAQHVRLALVAPGSDSTIPERERTYMLEQDQ